MRLQHFIEVNIEAILLEWVAFARTRTGADGMNLVALRDHAAAMLTQIVADLGTPQSPAEQFEKSQGPSEPAALRSTVEEALHEDSAAETHGADRATSGYTVSEMVAEFRALRASVLRLWIETRVTLDQTDLNDLMRFNEAIDQAVAESVLRFSRDLDRARDMFVAILSHDLRTPLQSVLLTTTQLLAAPSLTPAQEKALHRARRSTERMNTMIDDLLDFTRSRMGAGVGIVIRDTDVATVVREAVDEVAVAFPTNGFTATIDETLPGRCDPDRLKQVLGNLLANAAEHGASGTSVLVTANGTPTEVVIEVRNHGTVIPSDDMAGIFGPFKRLRHGVAIAADPRHLGLGLYIADQIVLAHGGRIDVTSTVADGTCFTVRLPRELSN